jgi:hypothetical protein
MQVYDYAAKDFLIIVNQVYFAIGGIILKLPDGLLECLNIKKVKMCVEVNSFQYKMKAYLIIFPIEEKKQQKYQTNLLPITSYEVRYIRHKDIYTDTEWGSDYDQVLADETTRTKRHIVLRTENNLELVNCLSLYSFDVTDFKHLLPYENFDSALVDSPIENYIENEKTFPHLFKVDYVTK